MKRINYAMLLTILVPLVVYLSLQYTYGFYSGANFDAYQYTYALREGPELSRAEFAGTSRVFVHAAYYYTLRPLVSKGLDAWATFASSSILFSVLTCILIFIVARALGIAPWAAFAASLLWAFSATALYYANIPEIYPMWQFTLLITVLAIWRRHAVAAVMCYIIAFLVFVQSILIVPMFLWFGIKRGLMLGIIAVILGFAALFLLLSFSGVDFMSNFSREGIYLDIAAEDANWLQTNIIALRQSGLIIPLLFSIPLALSLADSTVVFLLLGILPNLVFGLIWVKDQGAFMSPAAILISLLFAYLATKTKDYRPIVAIALLLCVPMFTVAWKEAAYDRSLGKVQVEFCLNAVDHLDKESSLVSTALFPRWLYVLSLRGINPGLVKYSPWAFIDIQLESMQTASNELFPPNMFAFADDSVHPDILSELQRELVYAHEGALSTGGIAQFRLYRVTRRGSSY